MVYWAFVLSTTIDPTCMIIGTTDSPGKELAELRAACPDAGFEYEMIEPLRRSLSDKVIRHILADYHLEDRLYCMTAADATDALKVICRGI